MARASEPEPDVELTWNQVLAWRIRRQHLDDPEPDIVRLVADLAGVQAQVDSAAHQAVGIRAGLSPDLDQLLWESRALVKTWAVRGTLHLLPTDEFPTWVSALSQREWRITPGWERYHGVTKAQLEAITEAIPKVVSAEPLTREELAERIVDHLGRSDVAEALASGWSQLLKPAANRGLLCQGPPRGRNTTFVAPAEWLPAGGELPDPDEAMGVVLHRFLDANGPATRDDVARWFGVQPKQAREFLAPHTDGLVPVAVDGLIGWMTAGGAASAAQESPVPLGADVYLLPNFDPYVLAPISHRDHTVPAGRLNAVSRSAGWISPVLLRGGRIAGVWELERSAGRAQAVVTPFESLDSETEAGARRHLDEVYNVALDEEIELVVGR